MGDTTMDRFEAKRPGLQVQLDEALQQLDNAVDDLYRLPDLPAPPPEDSSALNAFQDVFLLASDFELDEVLQEMRSLFGRRLKAEDMARRVYGGTKGANLVLRVLNDTTAVNEEEAERLMSLIRVFTKAVKIKHAHLVSPTSANGAPVLPKLLKSSTSYSASNVSISSSVFSLRRSIASSSIADSSSLSGPSFFRRSRRSLTPPRESTPFSSPSPVSSPTEALPSPPPSPSPPPPKKVTGPREMPEATRVRLLKYLRTGYDRYEKGLPYKMPDSLPEWRGTSLFSVEIKADEFKPTVDRFTAPNTDCLCFRLAQLPSVLPAEGHGEPILAWTFGGEAALDAARHLRGERIPPCFVEQKDGSWRWVGNVKEHERFRLTATEFRHMSSVERAEWCNWLSRHDRLNLLWRDWPIQPDENGMVDWYNVGTASKTIDWMMQRDDQDENGFVEDDFGLTFVLYKVTSIAHRYLEKILEKRPLTFDEQYQYHRDAINVLFRDDAAKRRAATEVAMQEQRDTEGHKEEPVGGLVPILWRRQQGQVSERPKAEEGSGEEQEQSVFSDMFGPLDNLPAPFYAAQTSAAAFEQYGQHVRRSSGLHLRASHRSTSNYLDSPDHPSVGPASSHELLPDPIFPSTQQSTVVIPSSDILVPSHNVIAETSSSSTLS